MTVQGTAYDVSVCVFPDVDALSNYVSAGNLYAASADLIQVGQTALVIVGPQSASAISTPPGVSALVAGEVGGQVMTSGG